MHILINMYHFIITITYVIIYIVCTYILDISNFENIFEKSITVILFFVIVT